MHTMDKTPKIITIIGLIFELFGAVTSIFMGLFMMRFESTWFYDLIALDSSPAELNEVIYIMDTFGIYVFVIGIITTIVGVVNLYLFVGLMRSRFTEQQAKSLYLYQAIWGGINILFNQITGVLYLISGVTGYGGHVEESNIRDGL